MIAREPRFNLKMAQSDRKINGNLSASSERLRRFSRRSGVFNVPAKIRERKNERAKKLERNKLK